MSKDDGLPREKDRARYCATFLWNVGHRSRTVYSKKGEKGVGKGKEVPKEDPKRHEFFRIDICWGIGN